MPYCKRCKKTKPDADFTRKDKVWKQCTVCYNICAPSRKASSDRNKAKVKAYAKEWRKKNADKVKATNVRLYAENREKYLAQKQEYYKDNKAKIQAYKKKYQEDNKEKIKERRKLRWIENKNNPQYIKKRKAWRKANRSKLRKYWQNRYDTDPSFRLAHNLRTRMRQALFRKNKSDNTLALLGCSPNELKDYIEEQFTDGMTWDNYGDWELDHIYPCAKFDLSDEAEQRACFFYRNLQPLWKEDNRAKSDTLNWAK